jgi:hypothetical protein
MYFAPVDSVNHIIFSVTLLTVEQKTVGGIEVLGLASKNLDTIRYSRLLLIFELEQFTPYDASVASNLPLLSGCLSRERCGTFFMLSLLSVYVFDGMPGLCAAFSMLFLLAVYVFDLSN